MGIINKLKAMRFEHEKRQHEKVNEQLKREEIKRHLNKKRDQVAKLKAKNFEHTTLGKVKKGVQKLRSYNDSRRKQRSDAWGKF